MHSCAVSGAAQVGREPTDHEITALVDYVVAALATLSPRAADVTAFQARVSAIFP